MSAAASASCSRGEQRASRRTAMPRSIAPTTRTRKNPRLGLLGAVFAAVAFAALASGARAQIPVTCNSDSSNDFTCGVSTAATGGASTAVGDSVGADTGSTTMIGAFAHREASDGATGVGAQATAATNGTAVGFQAAAFAVGGDTAIGAQTQANGGDTGFATAVGFSANAGEVVSVNNGTRGATALGANAQAGTL